MPLVKYRIYELSARAADQLWQAAGRDIYLPSQRRRDREMQINSPHLTSRTITHCFIRSCACCTATPSPEHPVGSW